MTRVVLLIVSLLGFIAMSGCAPLPQKKVKLSTPDELAETIVKSFISNDPNLFHNKLVLSVDMHKKLAGEFNKKLPQAAFDHHKKAVAELEEKWLKVRTSAQEAGVLWKTASYESCKYKVIQKEGEPILTKGFQIFLKSGGYIYEIQLTCVAYQSNFYVLDSITWKGEVKAK